MMPCKSCGCLTANGEFRPGIKQVGRTQRDGSRFRRTYRCQDCGALPVMTGDTQTRLVEDRWIEPRDVSADSESPN